MDQQDDNDKYTNKVDLWSLGCVVFEIVALSAAFPRWPFDYKKCCRGLWFPTRPDGLSEPGWGFIRSLLVPDPRQRFDAAEALKHDWVGRSAGNRGPIGLVTVTDSDALEGSNHRIPRFSENRRRPRAEIAKSPADRIPGSRTHEAKHDTQPTRQSDSKTAGALISDKTQSARATETLDTVEKLRKYLTQLETEQNQMVSKDLRDLNREYAKLAELASSHHSQDDSLNQILPRVLQDRSRGRPMSTYDLQRRCLEIIAVVYEQQKKYDKASAVYEDICWLVGRYHGFHRSGKAGLDAEDRLSSVYWKLTPNLMITSKSTDLFTFHLRNE